MRNITMSDKAQSFDLTVKEIKPNEKTVRIKTNEDVSVVIWKKQFQSEDPSEAHLAFRNMDLIIGSKFNAYGKVEEKEYEGHKYREMTAYSIRETNGTAQSTPSYHKEPEKKQDTFEQDAFGRRLALHGFINARLVNNPISQVREEVLELLSLEDFVEEALGGKLNTLTSGSYVPEILDKDIPF